MNISIFQVQTHMKMPATTSRLNFRIWTWRRVWRRSTHTWPVPRTQRTSRSCLTLWQTLSSKKTLRTAVCSKHYRLFQRYVPWKNEADYALSTLDMSGKLKVNCRLQLTDSPIFYFAFYSIQSQSSYLILCTHICWLVSKHSLFLVSGLLN